MTATPYKLILTSVYEHVTEVRFYDETRQHVKEAHPEVPIELPSIDDAVERAICSPTHIESSHSNSVVFVDSNTTNASGDPLRIPVKMLGGTTSGRIKTLYFATVEGPRTIIWRKSDD